MEGVQRQEEVGPVPGGASRPHPKGGVGSVRRSHMTNPQPRHLALVQQSPNGQREALPRIPVFQEAHGPRKLDQLVMNLPSQLRPYLSFDRMSLVLREKDGAENIWYVLDHRDPFRLTFTPSAPSEELLVSWVMEHGDTAVINFEEETRF